MFIQKRNAFYQAFLTIAILAICASSVVGQDKTILSFFSGVQYGTQKDNIAILISPDFKGEYTMEGIKAATWKDVTRKVTLASGKEPKESGNVNISKEVSNPKYVAIRYLGEASVKPSQRGWSIIDLKVLNGSFTIEPEWKIVNDPKNNEGAGWTVGSKKISFRSNQSLIKNESWAITPVNK
jgi:hypothetical protein